MNIIIKKHLLLYRGYKLKCSIGKSGITHVKKEGDLATPKGVFKLGLLYYRKDRNKSLLLGVLGLGVNITDTHVLHGAEVIRVVI